MSAPIHFKGTEYASVEAMPSEVRAAYEKLTQAMAQLQRGMEQAHRGLEQARSGLDETQRGQPAADPLAPACGGPRAPGAVPAPVEFDQVISLGPATAVHLHDGIRRLPDFGTPRPNVLVLYLDGLAYRTGKDIHAWRWEEVAVILSNVKMNASGHGGVWTEHEYALTKSSGEKVILDDGLKEIEGAIDPIKQAVFARLLPPLAQPYAAGQAVTFGPLTIHKQNGLQLDGKPYAWEAIMDIKVERGRFTITLRDSKKHEVRASAIPNIELLGQLIGLKFYEPALAYF